MLGEAIYKGATRPAMKLGIPLVPLVLLFGIGMLLIMWGGILVSWWVALAVLVAIAPALAWMRYVTGVDETGSAIDVRDPLSGELRRRAETAGRNAGELASSLLLLEQVVGRDLPANPVFTTAVARALDSLFRLGAQATYETFMRTHQ